jgi:lipoprotein-anchoring transpeptidase ErfK/SrfK
MVGIMKAGQHTCIGWRVLASLQPLKCVCPLVTAFFLLGIPIFSAHAETMPSRSVQSKSNGLMGEYWGGNSSAPRAGSSVRPTRKPVSRSHHQHGTDKLIEWRGNTSGGSAARTGGSSLPTATTQDAARQPSPPSALEAVPPDSSSTPSESSSRSLRAQPEPTPPTAPEATSPEGSGTPTGSSSPSARAQEPEPTPPTAPEATSPEGSDTPTGSSSPSARAQDAAPEANPPSVPQESAAPTILVVIDKPTQEMKVFIDGVERYTWEVSTGLRGYDTPSGKYTARSMNEIWYSKQWDDAPMPHAIFFTKKGHAVHGTTETKHLGKPASHGCVRLAPENARTLFALVKEKGLENTEIVLNGDTPKIEVASAGPRKQEVRQAKKSSKILQKSRSRKQQIKPSREFVDRKFDPREFEKARRFARRDWARVYLSPRMPPPPGYYLRPPGRRFFIPDY